MSTVLSGRNKKILIEIINQNNINDDYVPVEIPVFEYTELNTAQYSTLHSKMNRIQAAINMANQNSVDEHENSIAEASLISIVNEEIILPQTCYNGINDSNILF